MAEATVAHVLAMVARTAEAHVAHDAAMRARTIVLHRDGPATVEPVAEPIKAGSSKRGKG
ncbi:MAG TPA: hypothetical protein VMD08_03835 [Candidatus Baltobacteraceae bacterium]|nr:hypothetical protein [Candidatus Baltobacteraceae bacterium]